MQIVSDKITFNNSEILPNHVIVCVVEKRFHEYDNFVKIAQAARIR